MEKRYVAAVKHAKQVVLKAVKVKYYDVRSESFKLSDLIKFIENLKVFKSGFDGVVNAMANVHLG